MFVSQEIPPVISIKEYFCAVYSFFVYIDNDVYFKTNLWYLYFKKVSTPYLK